jgi:hypothetical protein
MKRVLMFAALALLVIVSGPASAQTTPEDGGGSTIGSGLRSGFIGSGYRATATSGVIGSGTRSGYTGSGAGREEEDGDVTPTNERIGGYIGSDGRVLLFFELEDGTLVVVSSSPLFGSGA